MATGKSYPRDRAGQRMAFHGMNIVLPPDAVPPGKYPFAQNVRAYLRDAVTNRATEDSSVVQMDSGPVHSLRRLNDSTPAGPPGGYILVGGVGTGLYANSVGVDAGFSGNPLSIIPFRPNASVQPWAYIGDSLKMDKVRSDGLTYKMGIAEPQAAPVITSVPAANQLSLLGNVLVTYWGDSPHSGPVSAYIWRNQSDTGSGPVRSDVPPFGTSSGNSLLFDLSPSGDPSKPMEWTTYTEYLGTVNTDDIGGTHNVHWVSGSQFGGLAPGGTIFINATNYVIAGVSSNTLLTVTTPIGVQTGVNYQTAAISGTTPVFTPALESQGYSDFNFAVTGVFYVPVAGTYTFQITSNNDMMWGIGSSAVGTASWPGPTGGTNTLSSYGQTKTALNAYPLIPVTRTNPGGGLSIGGPYTITVTFSAAGNYPFEIDYDYWYHSGRDLVIQCNGLNIPPIPGTVISQAQYRYTYRSSATGAVSNPSPPSPEETLAVLANTIVATPSSDPQVDKIDFYRLDTGLQNYTYVGTGPNSSVSFQDILLDTAVANNPLLQFDNFEPFPSIDLPKKGIVNVSGGVVTWVSGDQFNIRWLPGTIIIIGPYTAPGPVGAVAYTLDKRPTSTTQLTASNVEIEGGFSVVVPVHDGTNLSYEIAEPILAAQPLPYMWGPTDNVAFAFAVGDPLRPGTLYWSKGNNLDAAPDTNQQDVTSPSEPLQNGVIVNGIGLVMSTERGFLIYPNFFNALATVEGTVGSTWTIQESISTRGLYLPKCICVDGGGNVFFRTKDGVSHSPGGQGERSITDDDLYNLFPHEGKVPKPVTRGGYTVYPPDDTKPLAQRLNVANGYLYYDYLANVPNPDGFTSTPCTLVYDIAAKGWVVDVYQYPAVLHILEEGPGINGVLLGCTDGKVRPLTDSGAEAQCAVVLMPSFNAGDARADKHWGDIYIEADSQGR